MIFEIRRESPFEKKQLWKLAVFFIRGINGSKIVERLIPRENALIISNLDFEKDTHGGAKGCGKIDMYMERNEYIYIYIYYIFCIYLYAYLIK